MSALRGCARCGGEHTVTDGVELVGDHFLALGGDGSPLKPLVEFTPHAIVWRRLTHPITDEDGAWTHWAPCPTNGEPILSRTTPRASDRPWAIAYQRGLGQDDTLTLELVQEGLDQRLLIMWPADNDPDVAVVDDAGVRWEDRPA